MGHRYTYLQCAFPCDGNVNIEDEKKRKLVVRLVLKGDLPLSDIPLY